MIAELRKFLQHDDAAAITTSDLNKWKAQLLTEGRRPKTIRDAKIAPVRAILQWGMDNERLPSNAVARIIIDVKPIPGERKRGFAEDEAKRVLIASRKEKNKVLRWCPWLCAYSGARIAEVCQLRREDIVTIDGIWCMRITAEAGPLKTASSERVVPLHSALLRKAS